MELVQSAERAALRDVVHRYLSEHYDFQQRRRTLQSEPGFTRARWCEFAQLGWLGAAVPEALGGSGGTAGDVAVILDEFGRFLVLEPLLSCAVLPIGVLAESAGLPRYAGMVEQLASGRQLFTVAHRESPARGNVHFVETRARALPGGRYVLTGNKSNVVAATEADKIIVSARVAGGCDEPAGLSLFLLDPSLPGIEQRRYRTIDGRPAADLTLRAVEVGPDAVLGTDGSAAPVLSSAFEQFIVGSCAEAVGIMDAVVATTVDYLKTRRAYGSTLSSYQALQHRLADMLAEVELSRSMLIRALHALSAQSGHQRRKEVSGARILIGQASRFVASSAIQLHGAMGVVDEHIVGHFLKRLTVTFALCGSVEFHLRQYTTPV